MNAILIYLGAVLQVFGAWSIDFEHLAWEQGQPNVGIPTPRGLFYVDRAFFWNFAFFFGVVGGSILVVIGAMV